MQAEHELRLYLMKHKDKMFEEHVPVKMSVTFWRTKPKWCPKGMNKSDWRISTLPERKPDTDNLLKWLLDSMNGILVADDAQITTLTAKKRWSDNGHGRIEIDLQEDS
jgi:Holliday junction resolvase RusA-like endonuclease